MRSRRLAQVVAIIAAINFGSVTTLADHDLGILDTDRAWDTYGVGSEPVLNIATWKVGEMFHDCSRTYAHGKSVADLVGAPAENFAFYAHVGYRDCWIRHDSVKARFEVESVTGGIECPQPGPSEYAWHDTVLDDDRSFDLTLACRAPCHDAGTIDFRLEIKIGSERHGWHAVNTTSRATLYPTCGP